MDKIGYLAPLAFVLAAAALGRLSSLKREIDALRGEIDRLKQQRQ